MTMMMLWLRQHVSDDDDDDDDEVDMISDILIRYSCFIVILCAAAGGTVL